jgi:hypothetical protein
VLDPTGLRIDPEHSERRPVAGAGMDLRAVRAGWQFGGSMPFAKSPMVEAIRPLEATTRNNPHRTCRCGLLKGWLRTRVRAPYLRSSSSRSLALAITSSAMFFGQAA